ncbi:MAG: electron transfer flavoprotein subunit beta [Legionellales bacterium]|nr:electron transfer flavoprotein subunit beta [Legionellales bacterium]|tara:strand:+ start:836 stop:1591 length:756 start_codon:yes stop_codon:yes gene_type:complete
MGFNILVTAKKTIDYTVNIHVKQDESGVESDQVKMSMNPFDAIALEQAIRLKEQGYADQVRLLTIGPSSSEDVLRQGLAMGADDAVLIESETELYPLEVATCLKSYLNQYPHDLVIMGKQAIDNDCNQVGQMLAGMMGWPQAVFASSIENKTDEWVVVREMDRGLETLQLTLPAVITCDLRLNEPRYPTLPNILKAKQKPITTEQLSARCDLPENRPHLIRVTSPKQRSGGVMLKDVEALSHKLKELGYVR